MKTHRKLPSAIVIACLLALAAFALYPGASCKKGGTKPDDKKTQVASGVKDGKALKDKLFKSMLCPDHGNTLFMDEKMQPDCKYTKTMSATVDHMIKDGWTEQQIRDVTGLVNPLATPMTGVTACPGPNGKLHLDIYIMSLCPYGLVYTRQLLPYIVQDMGDKLEWTPHYIINYDNGKIESLHKEPEVAEDRNQVCIFKKAGAQKWLNYMNCFDAELSLKKQEFQKNKKLPENFDEKTFYSTLNEVCVQKGGLDRDALKQCVDKESTQLLQADFELSNKMGVQSSPTSIFNCTDKVTGAMSYMNVMKPYLCTFFDGKNQPAACAQQ